MGYSHTHYGRFKRWVLKVPSCHDNLLLLQRTEKRHIQVAKKMVHNSLTNAIITRDEEGEKTNTERQCSYLLEAVCQSSSIARSWRISRWSSPCIQQARSMTLTTDKATYNRSMIKEVLWVVLLEIIIDCLFGNGLMS